MHLLFLQMALRFLKYSQRDKLLILLLID